VAVPGGVRFAQLWAASTASALGSGLVLVAAPLYVAAHTSDPLVVSAATWRVFDRATVAEAYAEPADPVPYT
jgi:hypothetical protein